MTPIFKNFREFYPFYLSEHRHPTCRLLHFLGTLSVITGMVILVLTRDWRWLLLLPLVGYGFAWIGHFFFENNRPATFRYPFYSLLGDWMMFKDIVTGRISIRP